MKNLLLILFITSNHLYCQKDEKIKSIKEFQMEYFQKAEIDIQNDNLHRAYKSYAIVAKMDTTTLEGRLALKKSDSLKSLLRIQLKKELKGSWKLISYGSNWGFRDFLKESPIDSIVIISDNSIKKFIQKDKLGEKIFIKEEKIEFNNIDGFFPTYWELIYSDDQIWNLHLGKKGKYLHLTNTGKVYQNGSRSEIVCGNLELVYTRIE